MAYHLKHWESVKYWVQRNKFLISLFFGILIGWVFSAFTEIVPKEYRYYVQGSLAATIFVVAVTFWVADILYKYGKVQASKRFFTPFVIQRWVNEITIMDEDGSAEASSIKEITAEEGEEIPFIRFVFFSESKGADIECTGVKVNGKELEINPKNKTKKSIKYLENETLEEKELAVTIPIEGGVCPAAKIECALKYPEGAFGRALKNEDDSYESKVFHQVRLLKTTFKFSKNLSEAYMFDQPQPSFKVVDLHGNPVPHEEVEITKKKEHPIISSNRKEISWEITDPKVGLQYVLNFKTFKINP